MTREQLDELAALDTLGLLDAGDKRALEQHLRNHPADREVVARFSETAVELACAVEQIAPPPGLKSRVMASLPERRQAPALAPAADEASKVVSFRWIPWTLAASLALVSGLLVQSNLRLRSDIVALEKQGALDNLHIAVLSSIVEGSPDARAVCVWDEGRQIGVLKVENLPPVPAEKAYQLWVVDPKYGDPVNGGVFNTLADGSIKYQFEPSLPIAQANVFAVSLERKEGVRKAEGPMVLISKGP